MVQIIIKLIMCHLVGDYVLQSDFIARTKGDNYYHLLVHCFLYTLPFLILFGLTWQTWTIFVTHILIDDLKANHKIIPYWLDQLLHYALLLIFIWR